MSKGKINSVIFTLIGDHQYMYKVTKLEPTKEDSEQLVKENRTNKIPLIAIKSIEENKGIYIINFWDGAKMETSRVDTVFFDSEEEEEVVGQSGTVYPSVEVASVYPSDEVTVSVVLNDGEYNGAHKYVFKNSEGFDNGQAKHIEEYQSIQFVQKLQDGSMVPGVQSEQLVLALIDRHKKLNAMYPSSYGEHMINYLHGFLDLCKQRIDDRIARGVMGQLKK